MWLQERQCKSWNTGSVQHFSWTKICGEIDTRHTGQPWPHTTAPWWWCKLFLNYDMSVARWPTLAICGNKNCFLIIIWVRQGKAGNTGNTAGNKNNAFLGVQHPPCSALHAQICILQQQVRKKSFAASDICSVKFLKTDLRMASVSGGGWQLSWPTRYLNWYQRKHHIRVVFGTILSDSANTERQAKARQLVSLSAPALVELNLFAFGLLYVKIQRRKT